MPSKNIVKDYGPNEYYHIYSRGVAKQTIFYDEHDYYFFLSLLKRYLSFNPEKSRRHGDYPHYGKRMNLLAFCLMPNHIHMFAYQYDATAMPELMRALMTSYSLYFNRRYKRVGPVFQSRYKASRITRDNYLLHISRYIHLNPKNWKSYLFSSLPYYLDEKQAEWIRPQLFGNENSRQYLEFLTDYQDYKQTLDEVKWELAN